MLKKLLLLVVLNAAVLFLLFVMTWFYACCEPIVKPTNANVGAGCDCTKFESMLEDLRGMIYTEHSIVATIKKERCYRLNGFCVFEFTLGGNKADVSMGFYDDPNGNVQVYEIKDFAGGTNDY